ncbi:hypothetical protein E2C01_019763 [Portunus trituberculatus]|uniref:Uncharacterized protein n=1 Tax=Portunus trituberculatus TaxID=210409 RepID=A0A5B7DYU5_PORTR|nr:hypothetical protein [Portunus trituberculatus]
MALRKNFFGPDSSFSDEEAAMAGFFLHELTMAGKRKRLWMRSWLKRRKTLAELCLKDSETLRQWICLPKEQYQELLQLVTPLIMKGDTHLLH